MVTVYDFIRSAALVIGIGFTAQQDRKTWIWGDSILWGTYGLGLFLFPGYLFQGADSGLLNYLIRLFAAHIIYSATFQYMTRGTRDESVIGATLWSRLLSSLFFLVVFGYSFSQNPDKISDKTLYFDLEAFGLLFVSTVYQFYRGEYRVGGREHRGAISMIVRILFLWAFFSGLLYLGFPTWAVPFKKLDPLENLMARGFGALLLGNAWAIQYVTSFRYDEDRKAFFTSALVGQGLLLLLANLSYYNGLFNAQETLSIHVGILPSLLIVYALYQLRDSEGYQSDYFLRSKSN